MRADYANSDKNRRVLTINGSSSWSLIVWARRARTLEGEAALRHFAISHAL